MAAVVPVVAALAGAAAKAAIAGGLLGSLAGFAVSTAISQIGGRALSKKPKAPAFSAEAQGRTTVVRSSVEIHKVVYGTAKVSGPLVYVSTTDSGIGGAGEQVNGTNVFLHLVIPLAAHEVEEITQVYFNDKAVTLDADGWVTDAPYTMSNGYKHARVYKHLGSDDQAADAALMAATPDWTADHRLRGIAYLYVRLQTSNEVFPLGIPNVSAVVKGKKVYDPRTATTAWSDNAALCARDYLTADYGFHCDADEIDDEHVVAAANVCDEAVTLAAGGAHARYTCDGVLDTAAAPLDNLAQLVTSLAGAVTYVQGKFRVHAGAYDAPTASIPISLLAGPVKGDLRPARKELFNAVRGTYVDPAKSWQPTDFPFVTNPTYEAQDGGDRIFKDLELPFTTSPERAQRVAKLLLEKARQGVTVELALNHHAMPVAVFDTVAVTNPALGWDAKVFRVLRWSSAGTGPVAVTLQEESAASYDWASGEATTIDPAPDTNLPSATTVSPPGTPAVTEVLYATTDGSGVKAKAVVTWPASPDAFLRDYQLEYKPTAATDYTVVPRLAATAYEVADAAPGGYLVRVKAVNSLGVSSEYSPVTPVTLYGLTAAPADVQNLSLTVSGTSAHLSWDQAPDLDVRVGGTVRIRHTPALTGAAWNAAVDIGPALSGISTAAVLPLLAGTYLAKFVDSTGHASAAATAVTTDVVSLVELNVVETVDEHPAFAGDKAGVVYDAALGGLKLAGGTDWDAYPGDLDTWPRIDSLGGVGSEGTYDFAGVIDLGAVYPCRLTGSVVASGYDVGDLFDARTAPIDTWTSFDGTGVSDFTDTGYWSPFEATIVPDAALAPNGTVAADLLAEDATADFHFLLVNGNDFNMGKNGRPVTEALYVKPAGRHLRIEHARATGSVSVTFDLTAGSVQATSVGGTSVLDDYGIAAQPNGFFRVWVTSRGAVGADVAFLYHYLLDASFTDFYTGDGTSGVYLWGYTLGYGGLGAESANDDTNAALYLRTTTDDPSGTPVWSEPRRFHVGDYTARAFWPQLRLTSANTSHNVVVSQAGLTADMPDRVEQGEDIASGAGTYSVTFAYPFRAAPAVAITAQNLGTGDYYTLTAKTAAGFDVVFRNSAGTAVSRTFDFVAKGYGKLTAA